MRQRVRDLAAEAAALFPDHFSRPKLLAWCDDMLAGRIPFGFALWRVASFALWARTFRVAG